MSETIQPVEIHAPQGAQRLEIVWEDGVRAGYSHRVLRGFCPCAKCQGHQGPIQWLEYIEAYPPDKLLIDEIFEVGSYAIGFKFSDGHSTGIYRYGLLRALTGLEGRSFEQLRTVSFER